MLSQYGILSVLDVKGLLAKTMEQVNDHNFMAELYQASTEAAYGELDVIPARKGKAQFSNQYYLRKDCDQVVDNLKKLGFTNVKTEESGQNIWGPTPANCVVGMTILLRFLWVYYCTLATTWRGARG